MKQSKSANINDCRAFSLLFRKRLAEISPADLEGFSDYAKGTRKSYAAGTLTPRKHP
nr:hypothetical protein [Candidatus Freyarchaeota archaeon]